jgi:predicted class III extradiol MEMO1 family dioxygenase
MISLAVKELKMTGLFDEMDLDTDSDEHSLEMHLPYIRLRFKDS